MLADKYKCAIGFLDFIGGYNITTYILKRCEVILLKQMLPQKKKGKTKERK